MCGLAGIFDPHGGRPIDRRLLGRMTDALRHRGPDGAGMHLAPGIGLGHRRLAIIDLDGGAQPLFNEDGRVAVVFNGEIYNFAALAEQLSELGHRFRTRSDTEVIVHAWEEWGDACVERLHGMFAFAIWDESRQCLFLARDRLGKKPLYWAVLPDGMIAFASEIKGLLQHPGLPRAIDPLAVEAYFAYGYVPDPRSIYRDVAKLPPAHFLTFERGGRMRGPHRYWDVDFSPRHGIDAGAARDELWQRLERAVATRMVADVPLGAFLSGGVDSSAVVAGMARSSQRPVRTFSIAFGQRDHDESEHAAAVAARWHTDHHVRRVEPDAFDLLDRLAGIYDEPFGDASALPTLAVCAMARETVTVALTGDGGDELFAGYRRYRWHAWESRLRGLLPTAMRRPLFGALAALYPQLDWAPRPLRARATLRDLGLEPWEAYFASVAVTDDATRRRLFSPTLRRDLQGYHAGRLVAAAMDRVRDADPLSQVQYADIHTWLPGDILAKVDRASMANSLEVRSPLLDHTLLEWAAGLPPEMRLKGPQGKWLLKKAAEPFVPRRVIYRPKQGFTVPLAAWFRGPLQQRLRDELLGPGLGETGLFDMRCVAELLDRHQSGLRDHSRILWLLAAFAAFLRQVHFASAPGQLTGASASAFALPDETSPTPGRAGYAG